MAMEEFNKKKEALETQKAEAEANLDGVEVGRLEQEIAKLEEAKHTYEDKVEQAEIVPDNQLKQVENLGGSKEALAEETVEVDEKIEGVKDGVSSEEKFLKLQNVLLESKGVISAADANFLKKQLVFLNDTDVEKINEDIKALESAGHAPDYYYIDKRVEEMISIKRQEQLQILKEGIPSSAKGGEQVVYIQQKLESLENEGKLHGISARQLVETLKEVLRGNKTMKDLEGNEFTIGDAKLPVTLENIARPILLDIVEASTSIDKLKKIAFSFNLEEGFITSLSQIESGVYVNPHSEGEASEQVGILNKANEIMGLKEEAKKASPDSPWTDLNNPPTNLDKNAKPGNKIRK